VSLSVLVVEDNDEKYIAIAEVIESNADGSAAITRAGDLSAARGFLNSNQFDLLVLDIAVPPLPRRSAQPDGGVQLLEELEAGSHLRMPTHIVGMTAFEDVYAAAIPRFASRAVSLIRYDLTSNEWAAALATRVWFSLRAKSDEDQGRKGWNVDLAIVCALHDPELRAVLNNGWTWKPERRPNDPTVYYRASFSTTEGVKEAVAAAACQMGMTASAVLAMKMILQFRPQFIAMAGISAAQTGQANLGDVLVANPTWDWGAGKIVEGTDQGTTKYLSAPSQLPLKSALRERLQFFSGQNLALEQIRQSWPDPPTSVLRVRIGPVASGSAVVEDRATMDRIKQQQRELLGVEMEGYAVHVAAEEAPEPQPTAFVAKSAVDFGIPGKADTMQAYAAFTSARVIALFAEKYLWGSLP
jgi:nucleoside phosphorylase